MPEEIPSDIDLNDYVISEYLPNEEYTVDCLTDRIGKLRFISPRSRKRTLAGVCVAGKTEKLTGEIKDIAETINSKLHFLGLWFFQIKKDVHNKFKLMEISARCSGTMALTRALGVNLPLLSVYIALGYDTDICANNYEVTIDRTLISRYKTTIEYTTVYIDFDDTIVLNKEVNPDAIRFLYQCRSKGKKVILLTKHEKDLHATLQKYALSENLFHTIIPMKESDSKSDCIASDPDKAVFIDNSFQERKKVFAVCKIPVFDVDGIEVLLDWRR